LVVDEFADPDIGRTGHVPACHDVDESEVRIEALYGARRLDRKCERKALGGDADGTAAIRRIDDRDRKRRNVTDLARLFVDAEQRSERDPELRLAGANGRRYDDRGDDERCRRKRASEPRANLRAGSRSRCSRSVRTP
jgi:hypothetical protein